MSKPPGPGHRVVLRSMFREIMRGLRRVRTLTPVLPTKEPVSAEYALELEKVAIDAVQYREYLLSEIRHSVFQKFSYIPKNQKADAWFHRLSQGHSLVEALSAIRLQSADGSRWEKLVDIVLAERTQQLRKSRWAADYKAHKTEIDEGRRKELHPLEAKRQISRRMRASAPETKELTEKAYKTLLAESRDNASWVVRNYLKQMQLAAKIPNPYKLPYVSANMRLQALEHPKMVNILPGSTRSGVLHAAYDMSYVDVILKPEIEYALNKRHFLDKYTEIVNKKGPSRVLIASTQAGIMSAHFLRSPEKDKLRMRQIAVDIKKLTRALRKQQVWNFDPAKNEKLTERKFDDGYGVRGSKGYSMDEIMYPKTHLADLARGEGRWEFLMKLEELKTQFGTQAVRGPKIALQLQQLRDNSIQEWLEPLDIASAAIEAEVQLFHEKYRLRANSPIFRRRDTVQQRMNKRYESIVRRTQELVAKMEGDHVCAHSDLYHRGTAPVHLVLGRVPEKERVGAGKALGDYIEEAGLRGYRMGYEFQRRLEIVRRLH